MSRNLALLGLTDPDDYLKKQLCAVIFDSTIFISTLGVRPLVYTGVVQSITGLVNTDINNIGVDTKPGWLINGPRDPFGDRAVEHCKIEGAVIPSEVSTTLGAAYHQLATHPNCVRIYNNADPTKIRIFSLNSSTGGTVAASQQYLTNPLKGYSSTPAKSTITTSLTHKYNMWYFTVKATTPTWTVEAYSVITGYLFRTNTSSGNHYREGSFRIRYRLNSSSTWYQSSSSTNSGLMIYCYNAPMELNSISRYVVTDRIERYLKTELSQPLASVGVNTLGTPLYTAIDNAATGKQFIDLAWLEFFRDSSEPQKLVKPLLTLPKGNFKNPAFWCQLYLWFIFGVRPTIGAVKDLIVSFRDVRSQGYQKSLKAFCKQCVTYGTSYSELTEASLTWSVKSNARLRLRPRPDAMSIVEGLFAFFQSIGLRVDARNVWELVPYSFIIDWFINTADFMKHIDVSMNTFGLDILQVVSSNKLTSTTFIDSDIGDFGFADLTIYRRTCSPVIPQVPFDFKFKDPSGHWLEGSALIVSRF